MENPLRGNTPMRIVRRKRSVNPPLQGVLVMILHSPFLISSRLLPALKVADLTISYDGRTIFFDFADGREFEESEYRPGCSHDLQSCFADILGFMSACGESKQFEKRHPDCTGEHSDLFVPAVAEFCAQYSDDLACLSADLEETPDLITEGE
jgi:hypothetical protein